MSKIIFVADSGMKHDFDPDEDFILWPKGLEEALQRMRYGDRLILQTMCADLLHALHKVREAS